MENQQEKIQQKRADEAIMHWETNCRIMIQEEDGELNIYEFSRAMLKATGKAAFFLPPVCLFCFNNFKKTSLELKLILKGEGFLKPNLVFKNLLCFFRKGF